MTPAERRACAEEIAQGLRMTDWLTAVSTVEQIIARHDTAPAPVTDHARRAAEEIDDAWYKCVEDSRDEGEVYGKPPDTEAIISRAMTESERELVDLLQGVTNVLWGLLFVRYTKLGLVPEEFDAWVEREYPTAAAARAALAARGRE